MTDEKWPLISVHKGKKEVLNISDRDKVLTLNVDGLHFPVTAVSYPSAKKPAQFYNSPLRLTGSHFDVEENSWSEKIQKMEISNLDCDYLEISSQDTLSVSVSGNIKAMRFQSYFLGVKGFLDLTVNSSSLPDVDSLVISDKDLGLIRIWAHCKKVIIKDCLVSSSSILGITSHRPDTLVLDHVEFSGQGLLSIDQGFYSVGGAKTVLLIENTDISKIKLDYSDFFYQPYFETPNNKKKQDWSYSKTKQNFLALIQGQKASFNEAGMTAASADFARFEDQKNGLTRFLSPIKRWWNNYGFDKVKVVYSILSMFLGIVVFNALFFRYVVAVYKISSIDTARARFIAGPLTFKKSILRFILVCFYSGYLFFGLKLDVSKLELKSYGLAIVIIMEYTAGIISMAYLANLILAG
ncbi:hypothetical protein GCM10022246_24900 [Pedobacter ginsengiterrae]|uniref:Uncharacterized protein n=1 Tax=Pedobacter ginsengiterrae TaxID=871696 RepID=A0ABP7PUV1_9SPHI